MRLSPPTKRTFWLAVLSLTLGIVLWVSAAAESGTADLAYWLTAAGAILLVLGSLFNRI